MIEQEPLRQRLRDFLNQRDMRLEEARRFIGISQGTLSKFLNAKTTLIPRNEYKVKKFLGENN